MKLWQEPLPERYMQMSDEALAEAITQHRRRMGNSLLILGHHYQQDEIIQHADLTGDSLKLAQIAAQQTRAGDLKFIVFCGVHFMAETAAMLTSDRGVQVILPDLSAGCSMADMADIEDALNAWDELHEALGANWNGRVIPITYINSSAAVKAFVGERGGACCTSSNAREVLEWALRGGDQPLAPGEEVKIFFLPDQHLGRNTASSMGMLTEVDERAGKGPSQTAVWDPRREGGGLSHEQIRRAKVLLWAGHCSVHMQFQAEDADRTREQFAAQGDEITVLVHPECRKEVVDKADLYGSTGRIIRIIETAPPGSNWAIGTEVHLVNRLARQAAQRGVHVQMLSRCHCLCATMYRINQQHLLWALDNLARGTVVNRIEVPPAIAKHALISLERMLALAGNAGTPQQEPAILEKS